jgi:hypothetical protein
VVPFLTPVNQNNTARLLCDRTVTTGLAAVVRERASLTSRTNDVRWWTTDPGDRAQRVEGAARSTSIDLQPAEALRRGALVVVVVVVPTLAEG